MIFDQPILILLCIAVLRRLNRAKGFELYAAAGEWALILDLLEASLPEVKRGKWLENIVKQYIEQTRHAVSIAQQLNMIVGGKHEG